MQLGDGVSKLRNGATGPAGASVGAQAIGYALLPFFAKNVLISAFVGSRKGCWLFPARAVPVGLGTVHEMASKYSLTTGRHASRARFDAGEGSMSFHVVRHEHPTIFVVNRQTYETYRFTIGDDVARAGVGPPSDLAEARRTAIAFLAQRERENPPR